MLTVFKYELNNIVEIEDPVTIELPEDAKILKVDMLFENICLWALVNTENKRVKRFLRIFDTDQPIDPSDNMKYINTFQILGGHLVYHVFEILQCSFLPGKKGGCL